MKELHLNGEMYDLDKIKETDRALFLEYCKLYGKKVKKSWINRIIDFNLFLSTGRINEETVESIYASDYWYKKNEEKEMGILKKKLNKWKIKND